MDSTRRPTEGIVQTSQRCPQTSETAECTAARAGPQNGLAALRATLIGRRRTGSCGMPVLLEEEMGWLLDTDAVRQIHDHLPSSEVRKAFHSVRILDALPLIDPGTRAPKSIIVGLSAEHSDGRMRTNDSTVIPLVDDLLPRLKRIGVDADSIAFLLLSRERFLELTSLAQDTAEAMAARRKILDELDPEASARVVFPQVLSRAMAMRASDIHIEPRPGGYDVRLRVNGKLERVYTLPLPTGESLVNVLKVEARLKCDEHRLPQDGRISLDSTALPEELRSALRGVSLRLSTLPTAIHEHGEKAVCRLLRAASPEDFDLDRLQFPEPVVSELKDLLRSPHGIILVTGPTGSGKSTTLYSILRHLNTGECNILTAEDPVEVRFPNMDQSQVDHQIELTFARLLRSILRQDPDIILVGEVRDEETAQIAVQAAQTGHLVLATIHANDTFGVLHRLSSFHISTSQLVSSLRAVIAQRLIRKLCPSCRERYDGAEELNHLLGGGVFAPGAFFLSRPRQRIRGAFCQPCSDTGYVGRIPVVELWVPSVDERERILYDTELTHDKLAEIAVARGMRRMPEHGMEYVCRQETTVDEVLDKVAAIDEIRSEPLKTRLLKLFDSQRLPAAETQ